jgi:hypothetical protein
MIHQVLNSKGLPAFTSDCWHVVHARWSGEEGAVAPYERLVHSEHETQAAALRAAHLYATELRPQMKLRSKVNRDQLFLRSPGYVTSVWAARTKPRGR